MFLAGTWGADFHPELQPRENEIVLLPHKSIDVFETDLPDHLERMGITHLVIAGMTANLCCESTGRHAMEHGYDVTFLSNAIGAENLPAYEASIHVNYPLIANAVMEVDDFLAAVSTSGDSRRVHVGEVVRGSDNSKIGTVEKFIEETDDTESYMVVPKGIIFQEDLYIPMDAVVKRSDGTVFINVPKLVVSKMGWSAVPARSERQARRGPDKSSLDKLYSSRSPSIQQDA